VKRPPSIGEFVCGKRPARRRPAELELQDFAADRVYLLIHTYLANGNTPKAETFTRAVYDEHVAAVARGESVFA
jgi:hypothetical protein